MQTNCQQLSRCYSTLHRCTCFSGVAQNSSRITSFLIHVYLCCPCMSNCIALPIPIKRAMNKNDNDIISLDLLSQNALDDAHIFIRSPLIRRSPASDRHTSYILRMISSRESSLGADSTPQGLISFTRRRHLISIKESVYRTIPHRSFQISR